MVFRREVSLSRVENQRPLDGINKQHTAYQTTPFTCSGPTYPAYLDITLKRAHKSLQSSSISVKMSHKELRKNEEESIPTNRERCSMKYVETIRERKLRKAPGKDFFDKVGDAIGDFVESLYWMYYIHLPFYLMTSFDSFCLHAFFLIIFSLSFFGVIKYFLL